MLKRLREVLTLAFSGEARRKRDQREVVNQVLPARPQVARHQKQAALHLQLAQEIGWTGPKR
jgi:hypothetical protein